MKEDKSLKNCCKYASYRKDCDGDWDIYCMKDGNCQHQHKVMDCDRDVIVLCRK